HVRHALVRGLSAAPDERFADMTALLEALEAPRRSSWVKLISGALAVGAVASAAWGGEIALRGRMSRAAPSSVQPPPSAAPLTPAPPAPAVESASSGSAKVAPNSSAAAASAPRPRTNGRETTRPSKPDRSNPSSNEKLKGNGLLDPF